MAMENHTGIRLWVFIGILLIFLAADTSFGQGTYEILHDTLSATGWFGGDNSGGGPRTVGVGQSVRVEEPITLEEFSFYFDSRFDYAMNPDGFGHEVTLVLNIRDSSGTILQTIATLVPASFESGWVTWTDINMNVDDGTLLIFTTYLVGAYDVNQYFSPHGSDQFSLYTPGERYVKEGTSDAQMEEWSDWFLHPWDSMFWLQGTIVTLNADEENPLPSQTRLLQNYPNPFNPTTTLEFTIQEQSDVSLRVFDLLGNEVGTLQAGILPPGRYTRIWNPHLMATGVYVAQLQAGESIFRRKLLYVR
jgi:hypothetical protein